MSTISLSTAQAQLDLWIAADTAIAKSQSYSIGDKSLTRANAKEVTDKIKFYNNLVARLSSGNGGMRVRRIVPRDC